jgi:hypothetical protein
MATVNDLINRIRSQFRSDTGEVGFLSTSLSDSATNLTTLATCVYIGSVLEIENEQVYVTATPSANNYTVVRGWNGTAAAAHANSMVFYVDPRVSRKNILDTIKEEIDSWPNGIYHPVTRGFDVPTCDEGVTEVPFDSEVAKILKIERHDYFGKTRSAMYTGGPLKQDNNYLVRVNLWDAPADYTITVGLKFDTAFVDYATDLSLMLDMPSSMIDVIVYGVAWRNRLGDEERRVSGIAGPTINTREGASVQAAGAYKAIRDERLSEETYRLRELYGV